MAMSQDARDLLEYWREKPKDVPADMYLEWLQRFALNLIAPGVRDERKDGC
jgi:hypothetical protein